MNNYIIFIGSIYDEKHLKQNLATSPAANYWQISFLKGLQNNNENIVIYATHFQRVYPFGDLLPNGTIFWKSGFKIISSIYLNIPILKSFSIFLTSKNKLNKFIINESLPKCIITYNPTKENTKIALYFKKKFNIPWVDLCADSYDTGRKWERYSKLARKANAHVFLSYFAYKTCPFKNLYHFDGGIDVGKINTSNFRNSTIKTILYTGMLGEYGGIDLLLKSLLKINNPNVRLVICGHGKSSAFFKKAILLDPRITFYGLVSEIEIENLYNLADIFINPRPENINGGVMNFPSKILKYLSYGKPVISTKTLGLSPEYSKFLFYFDSSNIDSLDNIINDLLEWSLSDRIDYAKRIQEYISLEKNWNNQARNISIWLNNNILI